jgi:Transposase and inactivated derivatives
VTPQNKVNIGAYVSREVHRLLRSFEHVVHKPVNPMRHLNEVQVARAVTLIQEGWTFHRVAVYLNVSPSIIHHLWNRYDETGHFTRRVVQGRGPMTTPQDDRYLTICALRRRSATVRELQQYLRRITVVTVSDQTVRNRLRELSLRSRRPVRVPRLTQQHRAARLLFAARSHVK